MEYRAFLFDFDYTLGDATEGNLLCMLFALEQMGLPVPDRDRMVRTIGLSLQDTYAALTEDADTKRADCFSQLFQQKADEVMVAHTTLYPDALPTLQALRNQGAKLGVVTTKFAHRIRAIMDHCAGGFQWDCIVGRENVQKPKPNPEGLLFAVRQLAVPKEQVLYLGDSLVDALAAQDAGVDFVAVTTGTTPEDAFQAHPNCGVLPSLGALLSWLSK